MIIQINKELTGKKLKNYRLKISQSIKQVSETTGISKDSITNTEKGKSLISITNLVILCNYYNKSIDSTISYNII